MEKERRIKVISVITLIVAVLGLTVAFAVLSANLVINGTAKVEAGTWNIYFENLSQASLKGKAQAEGSASIDSNDKTRINGINVTLKQPMDEVIYTVELKNDGNIDAEILNIIEPSLDENIKPYIQFSATYDDNKKITIGDILKGGTKENVTISIKFKEDVTSLPNENLTMDFSYEINYGQTDKKTDENLHNGQSNLPQINYENLQVGSEVSLADEEFYVLENNDTELKLLAKYNLLVGNNVKWNSEENIGITGNGVITPIEDTTPGYGRQNKTAKGLDDNITSVGTIEFAKEDEAMRKETCGDDSGSVCYYGYWTDKQTHNLIEKYANSYPAYVYDNNSSLYKHVENYKTYLEKIGYKVKKARIMNINELIAFGGCEELEGLSYMCKQNTDWLFETSYWLGSAYDDTSIYYASFVDQYGIVTHFNYHMKDGVGIRPVIEIDKTK